MRTNSSWWWATLGVALGCVVFGVTRLPLGDAEIQQAGMLAPPRKLAPPPVFVPEPPPAEPSSEVPTLVQVSQKKIDSRIGALAREMADMWTRNPEELVVVIDDAARSMPSAPSVTLLLAIAHAETNGKILDVSEAGAVGLAQATPVAYHQEEMDGKLFVTRDYLIGSRAYIMKKPSRRRHDRLHDRRQRHARPPQKRRTFSLPEEAPPRRHRRARPSLAHGSQKYSPTIKKMDEHNKAVLARLGRLLDKARARSSARSATRPEGVPRPQGKADVVLVRYQKELIAERDQMLEQHSAWTTRPSNAPWLTKPRVPRRAPRRPLLRQEHGQFRCITSTASPRSAQLARNEREVEA